MYEGMVGIISCNSVLIPLAQALISSLNTFFEFVPQPYLSYEYVDTVSMLTLQETIAQTLSLLRFTSPTQQYL